MAAEEQEVLRGYLKRCGLKLTRQREAVLEAFLGVERHVTVEELYQEARRRHPGVSRPTVFRTLKLLAGAGLARTLRLEDKSLRYEHDYRHVQHDHLVCERCGRIIEVVAPGLATIRGQLCRAAGFTPRYHRLKIFGACAACRRQAAGGPRRS